uniref:Peptidase S1 domain-containing protein n=1 Tax=Angiostrongylus cantonensis TaxID=6313 RepID=A0A0K0DDX9_ANGCA
MRTTKRFNELMPDFLNVPEEVVFQLKSKPCVKSDQWVEKEYEKKNIPTCSAVLITSRHALTAAHCVAERRRGITCTLRPEGDLQKMYMRLPHDQMHVVPGTRAVYSTKIDESFTTYYVKNVIIHSGFNVCNGKNDLALLEFSPKMDAEGSPICMPKEDEDLPLKQERLTAAGFGYDPNHPGEFYLKAVKLSFDYAPRDLTRIVTGTRGKSICYVSVM